MPENPLCGQFLSHLFKVWKQEKTVAVKQVKNLDDKRSGRKAKSVAKQAFFHQIIDAIQNDGKVRLAFS